MRNLFKNHVFCGLAFFALGLFISTSVTIAQEKSGEDLKKKYAPILGEYEFDLSDIGGGTAFINFYIEDNAIWADSGDGRPAIMEPVEDSLFEFTAEDPVSGIFKIKFLKDDNGKYTMCRMVNEDMGLDVKGKKIER